MSRGRKKRISMRKLREVLRLGLLNGLSCRQIAVSVSMSHPTVSFYLEEARKQNLSFEKIKDLSDQELEQLLSFKELGRPKQGRPLPDWECIHRELGKKYVTLQLLWHEYKENCPDGYQITQFNDLYRIWRKGLDLSMRQTHKAGEKMFCDYAGGTVPIHDSSTGKVSEAQVFVGVLGLSNYTYSEASLDQSLPSWIMSHVRAYEYFEGVPHVTVPDNLKSGVSRACRYEPDLNPTYQDMASHYGTAIIPGRVRHPKDKAKVEVGVQIVGRWILAALRNRKFFSIGELNQAIREKLEILNNRPFKKLKGSRKEWFDLFEKNELLKLPVSRYEYAEWKIAKVNIDYHVELKGHYYSVPHEHRQKKVNIRHTPRTVEIFLNNRRIASHVCDRRIGKHTTIPEHMPRSHRAYLEWTPTRIIQWAGSIGPSAKQIIQDILETKPHPEQGYRSCLGIIRLGKHYGNDRLEKACQRALKIKGKSYRSVCSILESNLDQQSLGEPSAVEVISHPNIRGSSYYGRSDSERRSHDLSNSPHPNPSDSENVAIKPNERPVLGDNSKNNLFSQQTEGQISC